MKKALVLAFALVLGLGAFAFAGPLSGTWDTTVSLNPAATSFQHFFVDFSSSLEVDYTVGGWTFGSSSTFDLNGYSSQSFTATGTLGAFTFDSTMNFNPMAVTKETKDYGDVIAALATTTPLQTVSQTGCLNDKVTTTKTTQPAFTDWTVTGSLSIAGVDLEGLFYLDGGTLEKTVSPLLYWDGTNWIQTGSKTIAGSDGGSGWRFKASGAIGDATLTSYTYFNLSESDATSKTCRAIIGKSGSYSIANAGCGTGFTEEYISLEGLGFGCMNLDMALKVTCDGFDYFRAVISDISFLPWVNLKAGVTFSTTSKDFVLCGSLVTSADTCFSIDAGLTTSGDYDITGVAIYGLSVSYEFNGITFSADTSFNTTKHSIAGNVNSPDMVSFLVPATGFYNKTTCGSSCCATTGENEHYPSIDSNGVGYYDIVCVPSEYYEIWEKFAIEASGDSCCGGSYDFTVTTYFGKPYTLDGFAWRYYFKSVDTTNYDVELGPWIWDKNNSGLKESDFYTWKAPADKSGSCWYVEQASNGPHYTKGSQDTLFGWAETEVSGTFGIASNFSLTGGLSVSVYGWNKLDFGFELKF